MCERRKDVRASPSLFFFQTLKIMRKAGRVRGKVTVRRKPKLSSNKGGFLVARVSALNKKINTRNG